MLEILLESLPMSLGVALSPLPIAATLVLMLTPRARTNTPAFLAGWVVGILVVAVLVFLTPGLETNRGDPTATSGYARVVVGLALLALAALQWRRRPAADAEIATPALLEGADQFNLRKSLTTGFLLSALNPKNLLLIAGAANLIDTAQLTPAGQATALSAFTLVASSTIIIPVLGHLLFRREAEAIFGRWKVWLIRRNVVVMAALLLLFGLLLIASGAGILLR